MFMKDLLFKLFKRKRCGGNNQFEIVYGMSVGEDEIYAPAFVHGRKVLVSRGDGWGRSVVKTVNNTCYQYKYDQEVICRPGIQCELLLSSGSDEYRKVIITEILE